MFLHSQLLQPKTVYLNPVAWRCLFVSCINCKAGYWLGACSVRFCFPMFNPKMENECNRQNLHLYRSRNITRLYFMKPLFGQSLRPLKSRRKIEEMLWSNSVEQLLLLVGNGRIDISACTDVARAILQDGVEHETISKLAQLGAFGSSQSNAERDLHRWMKNLFGLSLQTYTVFLPLKVGWCLVQLWTWYFLLKGYIYIYVILVFVGCASFKDSWVYKYKCWCSEKKG